MTVLFKVPPAEQDGEIITLCAKPFEQVAVGRGDRVFLWWSEAQRGAGLAGHGLCHSARFDGTRWHATVEVINDRFREFGKADLAMWRDVASPSPQATLSRKLYRHALNKVVALSASEVAFLDAVLAGRSPSQLG